MQVHNTDVRRPRWMLAILVVFIGAFCAIAAYLIRAIQFEDTKYTQLVDSNGQSISLSNAKQQYGVEEVLNLAEPGDPVPIPTIGAYWGTYLNPNPEFDWSITGRKNKMAMREEQIGRGYVIDREFYTWGKDVPSSYQKWTVEQGRIPHISIKGPSGDWKGVGSGRHDAYIKRVADSIKAMGVPVFFTFHHEPDNNVGSYGTAADYRAAWRRINQIFEEKNVNNAAMTIVTIPWTFKSNPTLANNLYPGDDVIDWIATDPYNFFTRDGQWRDLSQTFDVWYKWARDNHPSKPLMFGEWGTNPDPNNANRVTEWFDNVLNDLKDKYPAVKAIVYFDSHKQNEGNNWLVNQTPQMLAAYKSMANDPYFTPLFGETDPPPPPPDPDPEPTDLPSPPVNVSVQSADKSLKVTWDANPADQGVTKYAVRYKKSSGNTWSWLPRTTGTSDSIPGLSNGTSYDVQVRAIVNEGSRSNYSPTVMGTPSDVDTSPPSTPTGLKLSVWEKGVRASWSENYEPDLKTYAIQYKESGASSYTWLARTTETGYTIEKLSYGKTYDVQVRAVDTSEVLSEWSAPVSIRYYELTPEPAVPTGLKLKKVNSTTVKATWNANTESDLKTYAIRYRTAGSNWVWPGRTTSASKNLKNLRAGRVYEVQVRAIDNQENKSDYTNSVYIQL